MLVVSHWIVQFFYKLSFVSLWGKHFSYLIFFSFIFFLFSFTLCALLDFFCWINTIFGYHLIFDPFYNQIQTCIQSKMQFEMCTQIITEFEWNIIIHTIRLCRTNTIHRNRIRSDFSSLISFGFGLATHIMMMNNDDNHSSVISDELIREVETRMNRNYLPPALKLHISNNAGQHSPPTVAQCPTTNTSAIARRFGSRACKLPTVQEVGKLMWLLLFQFCVHFF